MSYRVEAEWDDTGWWVVTVPDVPGAITQSRRLDQVPADAAEVIEIQTGEPVNPDSLVVYPSLPGEAGEAAAEARRLRAEAHELSERASERTRAAVDLLHRRGFPLRDIGKLTGITYQRAQQLVKS
ncbi:type II toxin-antitoxin system HicB family antitoxin [Pseudonocardia hispaniensis]|uniref:Type II toxin-antitoxin system HicB family antitoxin n=1 Tax=Pseudonocardia hispaniensis TaxID=904933 RepID=A0ABW1IX68_9PSEU